MREIRGESAPLSPEDVQWIAETLGALTDQCPACGATTIHLDEYGAWCTNSDCPTNNES